MIIVRQEPAEAELERGARHAPQRFTSAFLPAVSFALADVAWRVIFRLAGIAVQPTPDYARTVEMYLPWGAAIITLGLAAWLLLRPGLLPALALGGLQALQATVVGASLALYAWARLSGDIVFGARSGEDGWVVHTPYGGGVIAPDPWKTELLHLTLYVLAIALLVRGVFRHRRARQAAERAAMLDAF